ELAEEVEIALFRVLQESLTNAAKYAQATRVRVRLECDPHQCRLEIEDNGRGFRADEVRPDAQGLIGMRQRTEARNGRLEVRSVPGAGTLIRACLPMQPPPAYKPARPGEPGRIAHPSGDAHGIAGA